MLDVLEKDMTQTTDPENSLLTCDRWNINNYYIFIVCEEHYNIICPPAASGGTCKLKPSDGDH